MGYSRRGHTLLEVLLAMSIAALLMGGLYVSMDVQIRLAEAGRERVEESALARALLTKIANDVRSALTPIRASEAATGGGGSGDTAAASTSTTAGTTGTTGATTTSSTPESSASLNVVSPFNCGLQGDQGVLTIYTARVPGVGKSDPEIDSAPNGGADIRRITWWLTGDGGLARQEISRLSADDEGTQLPPNVSEPQRFVVAPEVVELAFRFFDGTNWLETWDGATAGDDGATPIGPPRAVEIVIGIRSPSDPNRMKKYRHVIAIQSANAQPSGTNSATTNSSTTTPSTTGSNTP